MCLPRVYESEAKIMAKYRYQQRVAVPTSDENQKRMTTKRKIKEIKRISSETPIIKIVTENGNKVEISKDDYEERDWKALWKYLSEGDTIELDCYAGRIIDCYVEVAIGSYIITDFEEKPEEISLVLLAEQDREITIKKTDVENNVIICKDEDRMPIIVLNWEQICGQVKWKSDRVEVTFLGERVAEIVFLS